MSFGRSEGGVLLVACRFSDLLCLHLQLRHEFPFGSSFHRQPDHSGAPDQDFETFGSDRGCNPPAGVAGISETRPFRNTACYLAQVRVYYDPAKALVRSVLGAVER